MMAEVAFKRGLAVGLARPQMNVAAISAELHVSKRTVYTWVSEFRRGKRLPSMKPGRPKRPRPEATDSSADWQ